MIAALTATAVMTGAMAVTAGAEGHVFGYTCMDLTNPFHIAMRDAMQEAVEANGDTLIAIDGQQQQIKQNDVIEDLITQGIEALFLNPVDSASVQPELEACPHRKHRVGPPEQRAHGRFPGYIQMRAPKTLL